MNRRSLSDELGSPDSNDVISYHDCQLGPRRRARRKPRMRKGCEPSPGFSQTASDCEWVNQGAARCEARRQAAAAQHSDYITDTHTTESSPPGRTGAGGDFWLSTSVHTSLSFSTSAAPSSPPSFLNMTMGGDFGNPLRKFKLVFLGEQSGKSLRR